MGNVEVAFDVVGVWEASGTYPEKIKPSEHPKEQISKAHPVWR